MGPSHRPRDLEAARSERAAEDHGLGVLTDIDKAAGSDNFAAEAADIDIAALVDFGKREEGEIEPTAVVEIELVGLVDHRLIVSARAGLIAGCRHTADQALLVGEHDVVDRIFLGGQRGNASRDSRTEIADRTTIKLKGGAPCHDLAD